MKNYRLNIIFRILFITTTIGTGMYVLLYTQQTALFVLIAFLLPSQIYELIRYIDITNEEVKRFLEAIRYSDFSMHSGLHKLGGSFKALSRQINSVMEQFQNARKEKEEQYQYLQMVIQHIGVGIITFDENGKTELINQAAKRLFKIKSLIQIQSLNELQPGFGDYLMHLPVRKKIIHKMAFAGDIVQLLLYAADFRMQNRNLKMIIVQNIQSELEEKELEAWQKLIRVLTHEIINSITPIASMAGTAHQMVRDQTGLPQAGKSDPDSDLLTALSAIQKRSEGMVMFVEKFRNLTKIPHPNFKTFPLSPMFDRIRILMNAGLSEHRIRLSATVQPEHLELTADPNLIEQVIINLLNNSIHALSGRTDGQIALSAGMDELSKVVITVKDNGPGIAEDIQEKIFIPFFTTRQEGSGIGLSLSRQIMRAHGGNIKLISKPGENTVFILNF